MLAGVPEPWCGLCWWVMCGWRRWRFVRLLDLLGAEAEVEGGVLRDELVEIGVPAART